jgi:hypothetical protein
MRGPYNPFYGNSFLLFYAYILECCQLTSLRTIIDVQRYLYKLSKAICTTDFQQLNYDVSIFFSNITAIFLFIGNQHCDFLLKVSPYLATSSDVAKCDVISNRATSKYLLFDKDGWYYSTKTGLAADAFALITTKTADILPAFMLLGPSQSL